MAATEETSLDRAVFPRSYEDKKYRDGFLGIISDFQKAGVLQDVVLEVEGRRFPCHRLVLSAASSYFRAMLTNNMAESRQETVVIQGLDPDMLEEILTYMYSGTLHVSLDKVQPLYQAADLLQVDYVRETCASYMALNVEHSTCLDMYKFADAFFVRSLKDRCLEHICRNFEKVWTSAEFCSLSVDHLTEIIGHNGLDITEETTVWEAVVRWVEHSREERQHHLPSILPHIRFHLMSSGDMAQILEHPLVRENPGTYEVIRNVVERGTSNTKMRAGMDREEMALIFSWRPAGGREMHCINPRTGRHIRCPVTVDISPFEGIETMVTSNNNIYMYFLNQRHVDQMSLLTYSHVRNTWEQHSLVCSPNSRETPERQTETFVEVDGDLYYLFFINLSSTHPVFVHVRIRKYDQHTDQWLECSKLRLSRAKEGFAVSCGPHIYIFTDKEIHRYHPSEDRWCKMATPDIYPNIGIAGYAPYYDTVVAISTDIFFLDFSMRKMFLCDTVSDSWTKLPDWSGVGHYDNLEIYHKYFFVLEGQLHVLVGYGSSDPHVEQVVYAWRVWVLDRSEGVWTELRAPNLPGEEYIVHCATLPVARMYLPCLTANGTVVQA